MKKINENINTKEFWEKRYKGNRDRYAQETKGISDRYVRFEEALKHIEEDDKVLDIGCGIGLFCEMVKSKYPKAVVVGCDIAASTIDENSRKYPDIQFFQWDVNSDHKPILKGFDFVFSGETLEHIDDPGFLFHDAYDFLKTGGEFMITTPNQNAINSPEHVWSFKYTDIQSMFVKAGFINVRAILLPEPERGLIICMIGEKK